MMKPASWRPADGLVLEPNALRAATETGKNLALTAGPGAGKSEMLAQRADFLLRTEHCRYPQRILAISFKVDASRNLRDRVRRRCGNDLASRLDSHTFHAFAKRLIDRFRPVLSGEDALDPDYVIGPQRISRKSIMFQDLVPLAIEVLRQSPIALNVVRQTYSHVFLDEFQDCTADQYTLVRTAFKGTDIVLTAVGDTKQRIMGWAGALEGVFLNLKDDFGAIGLNLYQNFRSLPRLKRMQNRMIGKLEPSAAVDPLEIKGDEGEIVVDHYKNSSEEAKRLAELIQIWIDDERIPHREIAVLVPRQPDLYAAPLAQELYKRGIPYRNEQKAQDLSTEPITQLIVDFLVVVFGNREPDAYMRLMETLTYSDLGDDAQNQSKWQHYITDKRQLFSGDEAADKAAIRRLLKAFLEEVGMSSLRSLSADYEQGVYLTTKINETVKYIESLWMPGEAVMAPLTRFSEDRAVRILTIHKSKGLEFDSVVMLAIENETFWADEADERAVFFVGISRAKRRLVLTTAKQRPVPKGATKWDITRTPQKEFLAYAEEPL